MAERAEFRRNRRLFLAFGVVFLGLAAVFLAVLFPSGIPRLDANTAILLLAVAAMAGFGLWSLFQLRKTGVIVVVDQDGITDYRQMRTAIPWSDVERCELPSSIEAKHLRLVLRPDSPTAIQFGKQKVVVNDLVLTGGGKGVRGAIARLAPQVPREW